MATSGPTPHFGIEKPDFGDYTWHEEFWEACDTIDAALNTVSGLTNVRGVWANSTDYVTGDRAIDNTTGVVYEVAAGQDHTSAATGTFADDRAANPAYWTAWIANAIAADVGFTPAGGISASDVQAALEELDTEKAPLSGPAFTGNPTAATQAAGNNTTRLATTAFVQTAITPAMGVTSKGVNFTIGEADRGTLFSCTGTITVSLEPAATLGANWFCWIYSRSGSATNIITVDPDGSETIDTASSIVLYPGMSILLVCTGSTFRGFYSICRVESDKAPVLGADLNVGGFSLVSVSNGDVVVAPDGTGIIDLNANEVVVPWKIEHRGNTTNHIAFTTDTIAMKPDDNIQALFTASGMKLASGATINAILDEDDLASDSAVAGVTQQSVKAYIDTFVLGKAYFREEQASGTSGGLFTAGSFATRVLNTTVYNGIAGVSLGSNQITLPAGTYEIEARAPAHRVAQHATRLYNVTDASVILVGSSSSNVTTTIATTDSWVRGVFTIADTKVIRLEHRCTTTRAADGLGLAAGFGQNEVYSEVKITRIA